MKTVIQLRKLKNKETKKYLIRYKFYYNKSFLFEEYYDINDLVINNKWKSISSEESMVLAKNIFGIHFGKYTLVNMKDFESIDSITYDNWILYEEDGFRIQLNNDDLIFIRNRRIESILN